VRVAGLLGCKVAEVKSNSPTWQLCNLATQQPSNPTPRSIHLKRYALLILLASTAFAQQQNDADYTKQIHQFTTGAQFTTEMVDHLPMSAKVPTPLKFFGYIAGAEGHLTYSQDVNRYMRALEAASPRVKSPSADRWQALRPFPTVILHEWRTQATAGL